MAAQDDEEDDDDDDDDDEDEDDDIARKASVIIRELNQDGSAKSDTDVRALCFAVDHSSRTHCTLL